MKRYFLFGLTLVLAFTFTFMLTLQVTAGDSQGPEPEPGDCCTYTNYCDGVGHGSLTYVGGILKCVVLYPGQVDYNPACYYALPPDCPDQ